MNEKRLEYLLGYADRLYRFQDSGMTFHKEINDLVNEIRCELSLKQPNDNVVDEFHIDKFSTMNIAIASNDGNSGSTLNYSGPLHVVLLRK